MDTQHRFGVSLIVKGLSRKQAEALLNRKLAEWLTADGNDIIPGYGYPDGSLLHYSVEETKGKGQGKGGVTKEAMRQIREAVGDLEFAGVPFDVLVPMYEWMAK